MVMILIRNGNPCLEHSQFSTNGRKHGTANVLTSAAALCDVMSLTLKLDAPWA
jgi:hypothetical protein